MINARTDNWYADLNNALKVILAGAQGNLMLDYGLCMIVAGGIHEFASGQEH